MGPCRWHIGEKPYSHGFIAIPLVYYVWDILCVMNPVMIVSMRGALIGSMSGKALRKEKEQSVGSASFKCLP
ncbi:hypothetical protein A6B38_00315 [Bartonella bacilliformis]|nr:hypothetical protein AL467_00840 [Bartonella bacilliformis]KZN22152.1 hypothetical protein A6B38_00315 [Bartonella bacilliformis]